jgi:hypothetical protein
MTSTVLKAAIATTLALSLSNCATVFNRTTQPVKVTSEPSGLSFVVTDEGGGRVGSGTTPGEIRLKTSPGYFRGANYNFTFSKGGKTLGTRTLTAHVSGWYAGNILIGGIIGMVVIDPLSGAMYTLPNEVQFSGQYANAGQPAGTSLAVMTIDQLSSEQRASLVRL